MSNKKIIENIKQDKRIQKFMKDYRYDYKVTMVNDLSELAYSFYLEGYNNGLGQHELEPAIVNNGEKLYEKTAIKGARVNSLKTTQMYKVLLPKSLSYIKYVHISSSIC